MDSLPGFSPANKQAQTALATGTDGGKNLSFYLPLQDGEQRTTMDYNEHTIPPFTKNNCTRCDPNARPSDSKSVTRVVSAFSKIDYNAFLG
jgi:hypothetical protein